ncbi:flagella synthesis protein FlgN [Shewanella saliphila]|uniref:Flagellar protein FlgN n=1 Tax=Shewanella saliphila TaxID=2282698 RepID=A0ABQ2Q405_9GAMM|nr:flagellar protein FlgN [Shewanella saliphila]MCL1099810.1 flagellar protein FlgN [Shewanella saliphila]GGP45029.1 flagellar protein FlgN [Shewanella saliphila]
MTDLTVLLDAQHQTLTQLKQLISDEKSALLKQDADKLLQLAKEKMQRMSLLKVTDEKLAAHPEHDKLTTQPELAEKVASAKAILAECKDINAQNANLIEHNIATINRLSQALQVSRNATSLTYNDKGKTSTISTLGNDFTA